MNDATSKKWAIFAKSLSHGFIRNCTPKGYNTPLKHNIPRRLHSVAGSPAAAPQRRGAQKTGGLQNTAERLAKHGLSRRRLPPFTRRKAAYRNPSASTPRRAGRRPPRSLTGARRGEKPHASAKVSKISRKTKRLRIKKTSVRHNGLFHKKYRVILDLTSVRHKKNVIILKTNGHHSKL